MDHICWNDSQYPKEDPQYDLKETKSRKSDLTRNLSQWWNHQEKWMTSQNYCQKFLYDIQVVN